ncbi:MAG: hypothetical protein PHY82_03695, partial [Lentisphaeria bacterium]|nr:hypothetical protein [Lentisphaeria bacterium]
VAAEQLTIEPLVSQCSNRCITQQESFPTKPADFYNLNLPQINASFENLLRPGQFDPQYHSLYLRVNTSGDFTLEVTILGKNILPLKKSFHLNVKYEPYSLPVNKIDSLFEVIADEDIYVKFRRGEFENRETENE